MFWCLIQWLKDLWHGRPTKVEGGDLTRGLRRSSQWPTARRLHLKMEPVCQWCHGSLFLEVHHISAFHVSPEKELDQKNLITLCERPFRRCHFKRGHFEDWHAQNPNVRNECIDHWK